MIDGNSTNAAIAIEFATRKVLSHASTFSTKSTTRPPLIGVETTADVDLVGVSLEVSSPCSWSVKAVSISAESQSLESSQVLREHSSSETYGSNGEMNL